jgi:hypothetical protein
MLEGQVGMNTKRWIDFIVQEVETALALFYSYRQFIYLLSDQKYVSLINENPEFWMLHNGSVQHTLFLYLGRLADDSKDGKSFSDFKTHCISNVADFSQEAFLKRKPDILKVNPNFLNGSIEPQLSDFKDLFNSASEHNRFLRGACKTIRNRVFAHAILIEEQEYSGLFKQVEIEKIEKALLSYWSISQHIWQSYHNARPLGTEGLHYAAKSGIQQNIVRAVAGPSNN